MSSTIQNINLAKEKWKNYHVFCTNIDVTKANLEYLTDLYGKRWNIENFYRDAENNFMIKTKTADFTTRYFFFLFMCIIYNLWYFIKMFHPIIAERWKDFIEDELRREREIERLLKDYLMFYRSMKFLFAIFPSYSTIFCSLFYRESRIL